MQDWLRHAEITDLVNLPICSNYITRARTLTRALTVSDTDGSDPSK